MDSVLCDVRESADGIKVLDLCPANLEVGTTVQNSEKLVDYDPSLRCLKSSERDPRKAEVARLKIEIGTTSIAHSGVVIGFIPTHKFKRLNLGKRLSEEKRYFGRRGMDTQIRPLA